MAVVNVLKVGYSVMDYTSNTMTANCTCTLIQDGNSNTLVDTLTAWDSNFLKQALKERGLQFQDVTHVVCTHGHSDHIGNLNLFTDALHIVGQSINSKDIYILHSFETKPYRISENVEVISSPGHTLSDVSVIVKGTSLGNVAVVGDLFEREEDIKDSDLWEKVAGSENPRQQYENRKKILDLADYIIPGHGPGFLVTNELRQLHDDQKHKFTDEKL